MESPGIEFVPEAGPARWSSFVTPFGSCIMSLLTIARHGASGRGLGARRERGRRSSLRQNKRFSSLVDLFNPSKSDLSDQAAILDRLSRKASSSLSIEEVCEQILPEVRGLMPFERLSLQYVDLEQGSVTEEYVTGLDLAGQRRGDVSPLADSPVQEAVNSRSSVLVALLDVESLDELSSQLPAIKPSLDVGVRSLLTVPVVLSEQVIAALTLESLEPDTYTEEHRELARLIGARISSAVANCQEHSALKQKAEEAAKLADLGREVGSAASTGEALEQLARLVGDIVPFDRIVVTLLDSRAGTGTDVYAHGAEVPGWESGRSFEIAGTPVEAILRSRSGILESGEFAEAFVARYPSEAPGVAAGLPAMVAAPAVAGGEVVATLTFRSSSAGAYSARDLELAERIAAQVTGALAGPQRPAEGPVVAELAPPAQVRLLTGSHAEIAEEFGGFAEQVRGLVPFERCVVAAVDPEERNATVLYGAGTDIPDWAVGASFGLGEAAFSSLVSSRSHILDSAESSEELAARFPEWPFIAAGGIRSLVAVPLVWKDKVFGALMLLSTAAEAYAEEASGTVAGIGSQIAGDVGRGTCGPLRGSVTRDRWTAGDAAGAPGNRRRDRWPAELEVHDRWRLHRAGRAAGREHRSSARGPGG